MTDRGARLSLLWVFAILNYLYCDLLGLMDPDSLKQYLTGNIDGMQITQLPSSQHRKPNYEYYHY